MINTNKVEFNKPVYYIPAYSGSVMVSILELRSNGSALVQQYSTKQDLKPFVISVNHIYNKAEDAVRGRRAWAQGKRKRRK